MREVGNGDRCLSRCLSLCGPLIASDNTSWCLHVQCTASCMLRACLRR